MNDYNNLIEENENLEHAYFAPLSVENTPDEAFECSTDTGCGELLVWNKDESQLECWNEGCELYKGE